MIADVDKDDGKDNPTGIKSIPWDKMHFRQLLIGDYIVCL